MDSVSIFQKMEKEFGMRVEGQDSVWHHADRLFSLNFSDDVDVEYGHPVLALLSASASSRKSFIRFINAVTRYMKPHEHIFVRWWVDGLLWIEVKSDRAPYPLDFQLQISFDLKNGMLNHPDSPRGSCYARGRWFQFAGEHSAGRQVREFSDTGRQLVG